MLSRYIRSWGGYKLHIGLNLPPKGNLRKEDKSSALKVSFIQRFQCICIREKLSNQVNGFLGSSNFLWVFVRPYSHMYNRSSHTLLYKLHHALNETDGYIHWQLKVKINSLGSNHITSKMLLAPYYIGGLTSQFHLIGPLITTKQKRTYRRGNFLCPAKGNGATSNNWTPQKLCFPSLQHLC